MDPDPVFYQEGTGSIHCDIWADAITRELEGPSLSDITSLGFEVEIESVQEVVKAEGRFCS